MSNKYTQINDSKIKLILLRQFIKLTWKILLIYFKTN